MLASVRSDWIAQGFIKHHGRIGRQQHWSPPQARTCRLWSRQNRGLALLISGTAAPTISTTSRIQTNSRLVSPHNTTHMTPTMTALPDFLDFSRAPQTKAATPIRTHSRSPPSIVAGAGSSPHAMSGGQTPVALSGSLEGRGPEASRPGSVSTGSPSPSHSHSHLQSPFAAHHPHLHQQQHFAPAYFAANGVSSVELGVGGVGVSGPSSASSTGFSSPGPFDYVRYPYAFICNSLMLIISLSIVLKYAFEMHTSISTAHAPLPRCIAHNDFASTCL